jgi:hypothetical protein
MLKLNGFLGTNPPALAAAGTLGHVVPERSLIVTILIAQGRGRAILHTGQTTITFIIHSKI